MNEKLLNAVQTIEDRFGQKIGWQITNVDCFTNDEKKTKNNSQPYWRTSFENCSKFSGEIQCGKKCSTEQLHIDEHFTGEIFEGDPTTMDNHHTLEPFFPVPSTILAFSVYKYISNANSNALFTK